MWVLGIFLALLALVLIAQGVRGRRVDDHPICRKCRFDLHGILPKVNICPECGSDLGSTDDLGAGPHPSRTIRVGNRKRSRSLVVLGSLSLLVSAAVLIAQLAGVDWDSLKPFPVLKAELRMAVNAKNTVRADELLGEILDRVQKKRLDAARLEALVTTALDIQADPNAPWTESWGDLIETYDTKMGLGDEQLAAYLMIGSLETIKARPRVRLGDRLPIEFRHARVRLGPGRRAGLRRRVAGGSIAGRAFPAIDFVMGPRAVVGGLGSGWSRTSVDVGDVDVAPGRYPLTFDIEFELLDGVDPSARSLSTWTETVETTIDLVPRDDDDIERIAPDGSAPFAGRVHLDKLAVVNKGPGGRELTGTLMLDRVQVPCSFEVVTILEGREFILGAVAYSPPTDPKRMGKYVFSMRLAVPDGFNARRLDVTLRPHPSPARYTVELTRIWGGEIVIEDVPVNWPLDSGLMGARPKPENDDPGGGP